MKPTLRQFEALLLVHRQRSLTKAAAELRVTQSAMSVLIRQLEQTLGVKLFDRTTRALSPTAACDEAVPIAERILADTSGLAEHMRNLAELKAGRIKLAVSAGAASAILPPIVARYTRQHPDVRIELFDVATEQLLEFVVSGKVELGIGSVEGVDTPGAAIEPLLQSPLCAIVRKDGPFAGRRSMTWKEIESAQTIAMRRGTRIRSQIDQALTKAGKSLTPGLEVSLITTALAITAQSGMVSILPAHMLPAKQFPSLVAVPMVAPQINRQVSLVTRAGVSLSPAARHFVVIARKTIDAR
jgi:DNA-binding transcriptional LysR family regulator